MKADVLLSDLLQIGSEQKAKVGLFHKNVRSLVGFVEFGA